VSAAADSQECNPSPLGERKCMPPCARPGALAPACTATDTITQSP
jgi:hypothetical protein